MLIGRAEAGRVPDSRKLASGQWIRDIIPITVEYGELTDAGFEYIGHIKYATIPHTATGTIKKGFFPTVVKEIGLSDADYEKRVKEVAPQLVAKASKFTDYRSINCDHCSKTGDQKERHSVEIVRATKDQKRKGKGGKFTMNLKEGDILQIGTGCMTNYTGLDVNAMAAFYELDREIGAYGPNGSPQNPAGWGYKEMGVWDFAERMVQYYNAREKEWLSARRMSLFEVEKPDIIYSKGTLAPLIDRKIKTFKQEVPHPSIPGHTRTVKVEEGCFVERKGNALMKGREFDMNEKDPNKSPQWFLQPYKGQGSVEDMREMWETGVKEAREYRTVMIVNEVDGTPVLDPLTGDIMEEEVEVPSTKYISGKIRRDWRLKIVPIFPPATDSKYVEKTLRRMMDWITNLKPSGKYADLQIRIQQTVKIGYVGEKTTNDMTELWRMFMFADFERRKKADKKAQTKQFKKLGTNALSAKHPNAQWYSYDKSDEENLIDYLGTIYAGYAYRWSPSASRGEISKAYSPKFGVVYLTPTQWKDFGPWVEAKKKKEAKDKKEREAAEKYNNEMRSILRVQQRLYPRPYNRKIPYPAPVGEFLDLMGWSSLNDPPRFDRASQLFSVNSSDEVIHAYLDEAQYNKVVAHFRPTVIGGVHTVSPPPAPTPSHTPAVTPTPTPSSTRPRITIAEAKRKGYAARNTSKYQGSTGTFIPFVEGWVTWVSRQFALRPDFKEQGHSIQITDPQGNVFVVFHPSASPSQPRVGNYYNIFDVEVADNTHYNGLDQTVITDPSGRKNLTFVDATSP